MNSCNVIFKSNSIKLQIDESTDACKLIRPPLSNVKFINIVQTQLLQGMCGQNPTLKKTGSGTPKTVQ